MNCKVSKYKQNIRMQISLAKRSSDFVRNSQAMIGRHSNCSVVNRPTLYRLKLLLLIIAGTDANNKISCVKLRFDDLEHSDLLENIEWRMRMLKNKRNVNLV